MISRRTPSRGVACALSAVALLAVAGCQKPSPYVTVVSGGDSVTSDATQYCFDGQSAQKGNCRKDATEAPTLTVRSGDLVGVDVAKPVAESGWFLAINGQRLTDVQTDHYTNFRLPDGLADQGPIQLQVFEVEGRGDQARSTGAWAFSLTLDS